MSDDAFTYAMEFGGREFFIHVTGDAVIHWDDMTQRRRQRSEQDKHLELKTMMGDARARARLSSETDNFTVSADLSPALFDRLKLSAQINEENNGALNAATEADQAEVDALLTVFFWEHVNPFLNPKLERES